MSSGWHDLFFNQFERVSSTDANRLQRFKEKDTAEIFRYLLDVTGDDEDAGTITEYSAVGTPLRAEILNGLMVRPQIGTFDLLVDPGLAFMLQPDAAADESDYKYVRDPGIATLATLTVGTNVSGSARIDVIECQMGTPSLVTDTRDVFNVSTGVYTATLVTKERFGALTYRVRAGTPGSGFPGTVSGWLPLAVALVPNGAASCDDCTFWDVRPLLSSRAVSVFSQTRKSSRYEGITLALNDQDVGGQLQVSGTMRASLGDRWLGGYARRGSPGTDALYLDLLDAANQENGYAIPATGFSYLYLVTPFGLPRWSRYTDFGSGSRVPRAPRGIPLLSANAPDTSGRNATAIVLPAAFGMGGGTSAAAGAAVCVAALYSTSSVLRGGIFDGRAQYVRSNGTIPATNGIEVLADATPDRFKSTYSPVPGTHYPPNAKALWVSFELAFSITSGSTTDFAGGEIEIQTPAGNAIAFVPGASGYATNSTGGLLSGLLLDTGMVRIPLVPEFPASASPSTKKMVWHYDAAASITIGTSQMNIFGWEF